MLWGEGWTPLTPLYLHPYHTLPSFEQCFCFLHYLRKGDHPTGLLEQVVPPWKKWPTCPCLTWQHWRLAVLQCWNWAADLWCIQYAHVGVCWWLSSWTTISTGHFLFTLCAVCPGQHLSVSCICAHDKKDLSVQIQSKRPINKPTPTAVCWAEGVDRFKLQHEIWPCKCIYLNVFVILLFTKSVIRKLFGQLILGELPSTPFYERKDFCFKKLKFCYFLSCTLKRNFIHSNVMINVPSQGIYIPH